ncbi:hypothetical protein K1719_026491 [Acacia pycnantha]|nr:hypothetical protein K1719_026491 [Acacia pycnantha]
MEPQKMKVELVSKQTIKPYSPTPQNLRIYKLSFIDQIAPIFHTRMLFSYPNIENTFSNDGCRVLRGSCPWLHLRHLKQPDADLGHPFVPVDDAHLGSGFLVKVQVNLFDCGGLAIGMSFSHKIADASTIGSFIKAWSCTAIGCMTESMLPKYVMESHFPSMEFSEDLPPLEFKPALNCITRRYHKTEGQSFKQTGGVTNKRGGCIGTHMEMCNKSIKNKPGNKQKTLQETEETNDSSTDILDLQSLVVRLRKALEVFSREFAHKLGDKNNAFSLIIEGGKDVELAYKEGIDFYMCSSWCRFGFYEADFGWGKPKWVSIPSLKKNNFIYLMDTHDGKGIEAWVTLIEQDMALVEKNHELLEFASLNPTIS